MKKTPAKRKSPQEKKRLSLERDCRNVYGQTTGGSRKGIRRRKRWVNRTHRRAAVQTLSQVQLDADQLSTEVGALKRKSWKKSPDKPLGAMLLDDENRALGRDLEERTSAAPDFPDRLEKWLARSGLNATQVRMMMRSVRAVVKDRHSTHLELNLNREEAGLVRDFLNRHA
ncbi:MAG TPA: hypothetical protein VG733_09625 [Chthoniobacteraceae bacterium]|nr:hypothetical protein [Chthoniobacteraceae bacterium]